MIENLLQETKCVLTQNNKTLDDVLWVGSNHLTYNENHDYTPVFTRTSVEEFIARADRNYDDGFGGAEVNESLILVGKDFWLERGEYDGSEWWEYKQFPNFDDYSEGKVPIFNGID